MGDNDCGGNWVLFWWAGPCSVIFNPIFCWWGRLCSLSVVWPEAKVLTHTSMREPQVCCSQSPYPCGSPLLTRDSAGDTQTLKGRSGHSLWGLQVLVHTVWALQVSLVGMGFDSKCDFAPPTVLLGLFLCPWTWGIFFWWDPTLSCRWLFSSELRFWSSRKRRWAHVLLLHRLSFDYYKMLSVVACAIQ